MFNTRNWVGDQMCTIYDEDEIIKYAVKEMTIEEIEKKLGHKVKVISKEAEE